MADSFVQLSADSTGKKIDTRTEGTNSEHRQVFVVGDPATNAGVAPVDATKGLAVDLTATGSNTNKLLVTPDSVALPANQSVNVSQINGVTPLMGNGITGTGSHRVTIASDNTANSNPWLVAGAAAQGAGVANNPILNGLEARDTLGTAVATGQVVRAVGNRYGSTLVSAIPPSHVSSNGTPIAATTTSVIAAPAAGNHLRIVRIHMSNGGATATWVAVRDGAAGTQHYRTYLPQNGLVSINLNLSGPLDLTTATRLDIVLSAAGSVEYEIDYLTVSD